jgi:hypothetical protein
MRLKVLAAALTIILLGATLLVAGGVHSQEETTAFLPILKKGTAPPTTGGHAGITAYAGPSTCVACHEKEAQQMHGSVHYQQSGPTPNVLNIDGHAGKSNGAFNSYCGTTATSRLATCAGCHVGYGQRPTTNPNQEQLNNIDCLMCHQEQYARTAAPPYEYVEALGEDGEPRQIRVPVEDENGFHYMPDEEKMAISPLEAARTVHATTRSTCLRCHAYASGSDGGKRGDLSSATASLPRESDVHLSPEGEDMACAACHDAGNHRVRGRGLDLRPNDVPERFTCEVCHGERPHGDYEPRQSNSRDVHAGRVACQSCHIPEFAKEVSTEVARDWLNPFYSPAACSGQGGWKPEEIRESNVIPTYRWFDGTSYVYNLGEVAQFNADGEVEMGLPYGNVASAGAKLYPMKEHRSLSALHERSGTLVPHSTFTYFTTGDFGAAVETGMRAAGLSGSYRLVDVHTYQTINHGVEPAGAALTCDSCHGPEARMDLQGELGYGLKAQEAEVCTQCHEQEDEEKGFYDLHEEHVAGEGYDCAWCHSFSRPDRGLARP